MSEKTFGPGPTPNTVRSANGAVLNVPEGWVLLPPGDPALTPRVKAAGAHWIVQEKKSRKVFSRGVWLIHHRSCWAGIAGEKRPERNVH